MKQEEKIPLLYCAKRIVLMSCSLKRKQTSKYQEIKIKRQGKSLSNRCPKVAIFSKRSISLHFCFFYFLNTECVSFLIAYSGMNHQGESETQIRRNLLFLMLVMPIPLAELLSLASGGTWRLAAIGSMSKSNHAGLAWTAQQNWTPFKLYEPMHT